MCVCVLHRRKTPAVLPARTGAAGLVVVHTPVLDLEFRVSALGFRLWALRCRRVEGLGCRFRVQALGSHTKKHRAQHLVPKANKARGVGDRKALGSSVQGNSIVREHIL